MSTPRHHLDHVFDPTGIHPDAAHSVLMRLITPGSRVLELECASGYLFGCMERTLGCRMTGLELDLEAVTIAQTRIHKVYQADLDLSRRQQRRLPAPVLPALMAHTLMYVARSP